MYEIDARTLRTVYATLGSVFPHVESWEAGGGDLVLVAAKRPLVHHAASLAARIQEEPFKTALRAAWRASDTRGVLAHFLGNAQLTPMIANGRGVEINTDDRNIVEFGFARSVGNGASLIAELRNLARSAGHLRPVFSDAAAFDWDAVDTAWVGYQTAERFFDGVNVGGPPEEQARQAALIYYYRDTDLAAARRAWRQQTRAPVGSIELAMVSDFEAETGSEAALETIERLRADQPGEAAALLATLRFRQSRFDEAAAALEAAFDDFRTSPWALFRFKERALALAVALAARGPDLAERMSGALERPFAIRALENERLTTLALLTRRLDFNRLCQGALAPLEPRVPWSLTFLSLRRDCYHATGDPRLAAANRDLDAFLAREPVPIANLLTEGR
jgi:hypothetical protein